jgi:hypothetical protein
MAEELEESKEKRELVIHTMEEQCRQLAEGMGNGLPELRRNVWCWPSSPHAILTIFPQAKGSKTHSQCHESSSAAISIAPCVGSMSLYASPTFGNSWYYLGLAETEEHVLMELVIADLDREFIHQCSNYFDPSQLGEGGGVRLLHDPMQRMIGDSVADDNVHTYVVFGSYDSFPNPEDPQAVLSGISRSLAEAFPHSWRSLQEQCGRSPVGHRVWMSSPETPPPSLLALVACVAYPRDQEPSEAEAAARRFTAALECIASVEGLWGVRRGCGEGREGEGEGEVVPRTRRVRIVTHAMGSFVGHSQVAVFAQGLAEGWRRFLTLC